MSDFVLLVFTAVLAVAVGYMSSGVPTVRRDKQEGRDSAASGSEEGAYLEIERFYADKLGAAEAKKVVANIRNGFAGVAPQYRMQALNQLLAQLRKQG